jgi:hypothetical protein
LRGLFAVAVTTPKFCWSRADERRSVNGCTVHGVGGKMRNFTGEMELDSVSGIIAAGQPHLRAILSNDKGAVGDTWRRIAGCFPTRKYPSSTSPARRSDAKKAS